MNRHRFQKGNVLIMAVFMSVFIFFICVALTAQNRQDIVLSLSHDCRFKACQAADSALDLALHVMRTNPEWAQALPNRSGELENGSSWEIASIAQHQDTPHLWEVKAVGRDKLVSVVKSRLLEEIPLASDDSMAPTHIFAATVQGQLVMLNQDFQWQALGSAPISSSMGMISANKGPLFALGPSQKDNPLPVLQDLDDTGKLAQIELPQGEALSLMLLNMSGSTISWQDLHIPSRGQTQTVKDKEGTQSSIVTEGLTADSLGRYQASVIEQGEYQGPCMEWYLISGDALATQGKKAFLHAIHAYYIGAQALAKGSGDDKSSYTFELTKKSRLFMAPAVLQYSQENKAWTAISDALQVHKLGGVPTLDEDTLIPDSRSLAVIGSVPYAYSHQDGKQILKSDGSKWVKAGTCAGLSCALVNYNNELLWHENKGKKYGFELIGFNNDLHMFEQLYWHRPQVKGVRYDSDSQDFADCLLAPELILQGNILPHLKSGTFRDSGTSQPETCGRNSVCAVGKDMYAFVKLRLHYEGLNSGEEESSADSGQSDTEILGEEYQAPYTAQFLKDHQNVQGLALAHYDGQGWQIWPGGMSDLAVHEALSAQNCLTTSVGALDTYCLAAATYPEACLDESGSASRPLSRFSIIEEVVK